MSFSHSTEQTHKATAQVVNAPNKTHAGSSAAPGEHAEASVDKPESNSTPSPAEEQQNTLQPSEQYVVLLLFYSSTVYMTPW